MPEQRREGPPVGVVWAVLEEQYSAGDDND